MIDHETSFDRPFRAKIKRDSDRPEQKFSRTDWIFLFRVAIAGLALILGILAVRHEPVKMPDVVFTIERGKQMTDYLGGENAYEKSIALAEATDRQINHESISGGSYTISPPEGLSITSKAERAQVSVIVFPGDQFTIPVDSDKNLVFERATYMPAKR